MSVLVVQNHSSAAGFAPAADYESWRDNARCRDMDPAVFFPGSLGPTAYDAARATCASCPVRRDCLDFAITLGIRDGMFGGMTARERGKVKSRRRDVAKRCARCSAGFAAPYTVLYCSDDCRNEARRDVVKRSRVRRAS